MDGKSDVVGIELVQANSVPSNVYTPDGSPSLYPWEVIHGVNGIVWQLNPTVPELDFESVPSFTLALKITDSGGAMEIGNIAILILDDNEAPSLIEDGIVRRVKEHSLPHTRVLPGLNRFDEDGDETVCRFSMSGYIPKGNGMFQWLGGESGQSWVSNCEISVKDNSATESIDYEALTADINGHRNLHIKGR